MFAHMQQLQHGGGCQGMMFPQQFAPPGAMAGMMPQVMQPCAQPMMQPVAQSMIPQMMQPLQPVAQPMMQPCGMMADPFPPVPPQMMQPRAPAPPQTKAPPLMQDALIKMAEVIDRCHQRDGTTASVKRAADSLVSAVSTCFGGFGAQFIGYDDADQHGGPQGSKAASAAAPPDDPDGSVRQSGGKGKRRNNGVPVPPTSPPDPFPWRSNDNGGSGDNGGERKRPRGQDTKVADVADVAEEYDLRDGGSDHVERTEVSAFAMADGGNWQNSNNWGWNNRKDDPYRFVDHKGRKRICSHFIRYGKLTHPLKMI